MVRGSLRAHDDPGEAAAGSRRHSPVDIVTQFIRSRAGFCRADCDPFRRDTVIGRPRRRAVVFEGNGGRSAVARASCVEVKKNSVRARRDSGSSTALLLMKLRMASETHTDPELLLILAKAGYGPALVRLLDRYRTSLAEQVQARLGRRLRVKMDVEDLLQEVSLEACRAIGSFRGSTEPEFVCWLRKILESILLNQLRYYFCTQRRDLRRERRIGTDMENSSRSMEGGLVAPNTSPTQQAAMREGSLRLSRALETLPALYRDVIVLRHLEGLSFPEVARRLGRTEDSVKNIWVRALHRLRGLLGNL
jgi:RNA polymerase sigma-70 factor, ECF subfamily